jgi:hypothetical protein
MKRYLVFWDRKPLNGISAIDSFHALREAKRRTPEGDKHHIRVRLANTPYLKSLASQGEYR